MHFRSGTCIANATGAPRVGGGGAGAASDRGAPRGDAEVRGGLPFFIPCRDWKQHVIHLLQYFTIFYRNFAREETDEGIFIMLVPRSPSSHKSSTELPQTISRISSDKTLLEKGITAMVQLVAAAAPAPKE